MKNEEQSQLTKTEKETMDVAADFAKKCKRGDIVLLYGDLGAGKTVFCKGFASGLGVVADVVSPTFTIINNYGDLLNHFDLYRINSADELVNIGAEEALFGDKISLVEWPERVDKNYFGGDVWSVKIVKVDDTTRKITIKKG